MRPWELLPQPFPKDNDPGPNFFYTNFVKPLSLDFIRLMNAGIHIDQKAVKELETTLDNVLAKVAETVKQNKIIQDFQADIYPKKWAEYLASMETKKKNKKHFIKPYNPENALHKTYAFNTRLLQLGNSNDIKTKWSVKDMRSANEFYNDPIMVQIIEKKLNPSDLLAIEAMNTLAIDKMTIYNKSHYSDKIAAKTYEEILPPFNPGSSLQLRKLFSYLKIAPLAFSKDTGEPSWGRDQIEEVLTTATDPTLIELLQAFVDYSYGSIIRTNFIEAFHSFTIDDVLYGNYKNFGAKTYRPTSNKPNLLNMPSTGSIYAKPLKKVFIAPKGYLVWSIDYSALEDRVIANLSQDENKLAIFTEGLDGHSLSATYYFPDRVSKLIGPYTNNKEASIKLKTLVDEKNKEAKSVRQDGKPVTFGISYGAYPPKIAATIKCSITAATAIFDSYHNEMFPDITKMRNIAMKTATKQGYLHLGLGCRLYSDNIETNSRTLFNALSQFWSILTLISVNELHYQIDKENLQKDIIPNSTIYDAIYGIVREDPSIIKWLNETICPIMEKDFLDEQIVKNEVNLEVGKSWGDLVELPHNVSLEYIQKVIDEK